MAYLGECFIGTQKNAYSSVAGWVFYIYQLDPLIKCVVHIFYIPVIFSLIVLAVAEGFGSCQLWIFFFSFSIQLCQFFIDLLWASFIVDRSFYHYEMLLSVSSYFLCSEAYLIWYKYRQSYFVDYCCHGIYFLLFSTYLCYWILVNIIYLGHFFLFIHSANLYHLIGISRILYFKQLLIH